MTRCKANPCCSNPYNCEVPLPQHRSGLYWLNPSEAETSAMPVPEHEDGARVMSQVDSTENKLMNDDQFETVHAILVKQMEALESIVESLQKLTMPVVMVNTQLSQAERESIAKAEGTLSYMNQIHREHTGLRNQVPAQDIGHTGNAIANALDGINGCGFNSHDYAARLLRRMQKRGFPDLTMVQLETLVVTYTGNSIESHWENESGQKLT